MPRCQKCQLELPEDAFSPGGLKYKQHPYCKPCVAEGIRKSYNENPGRASYNGAKARARRDKRHFSLSYEHARSLFTAGVCYYCDEETITVRMEARIDGEARKPRDRSPTLDCVKVAEGYTDCNVVLAHNRCNRIKNDATAAEHRRIADKMDEHAARRAAAK